MIFPIDWPLALAVLVCGISCDDDHLRRLNGPIAELGIAFEVWDRTERWDCTESVHYDGFVASYLPPYFRAMQDCPSLVELERFRYGPNVAKDCLDLNDAYQRHLMANRCMAWPHRWRDWWPDPCSDALAECGQLRCVWDQFRQASSGESAITIRREALKELRAKIGEDAWAAGWMPAPVPLHLFSEF